MKTFEVFFDGDCPLCEKEINLIKAVDFRKKIVFTDISLPEFNDAQVGVPWRTLMERIHGRRLPSQEIVEGVEVFRELYSAIGLSPLVFLTKLPGVRQLLDWAYVQFAQRRLRFTGRCLDDLCEVRRTT